MIIYIKSLNECSTKNATPYLINSLYKNYLYAYGINQNYMNLFGKNYATIEILKALNHLYPNNNLSIAQQTLNNQYICNRNIYLFWKQKYDNRLLGNFTIKIQDDDINKISCSEL